jgi:predicted dehydrogenase
MTLPFMAIYISPPKSLHTERTGKAINSRKLVLLEKPSILTEDDMASFHEDAFES